MFFPFAAALSCSLDVHPLLVNIERGQLPLLRCYANKHICTHTHTQAKIHKHTHTQGMQAMLDKPLTASIAAKLPPVSGD